MSLLATILERLKNPVAGYHANSIAASEPTALATLLLLANGKLEQAQPGLAWLRENQQASGALAVTPDADSPRWPTGLAMLAFVRAEEYGCNDPRWADGRKRAADWILGNRGEPIELPPDQRGKVFGHDTRLVAWPWVLGTHSWMEPTCLHVIALLAGGYGDHPRTQEARRLLRDRLLRTGGCNYGNTFVLGQQLRAHLQPSGMAAVALAGDDGQDGLRATLEYLDAECQKTLAAVSIAWGCLGLAANQRSFSEERLEKSARRVMKRGGSPYRLALLGHALLGRQSPLNPLTAATA